MSIKERVKELCKEKGISLNKLEQEIGVASGYLSKLDNPGIKIVILIADYFDVSVDYLSTGNKKELTIETADMDSELIFMEKRIQEYALKLSKLSEEDKTLIMNMIDRLGK